MADTAQSVAEKVDRLEIVDRSIDYHGGERFENSETQLEMCSGSGCYRISVRYEQGIFIYDVTGQVRGRERRVRVTNDTTEMWTDGEATEIAEDLLSSINDWAMARIYFCFLPFRLNDDSVLKQNEGLEVWGDRQFHRVKVTFRQGSSTDAADEFLYWFDPETARLEQYAYSFKGKPGGLRFRRVSNFRRIGDILFFDQENLGMEGNDLSVDQIDPDFVRVLDPISIVELRGITVESLD